MPEDASKGPGPFDVQTIRQLVALMSRNDLSEIDLHDGTQRIRLRRGQLAVAPTMPLPAVPMAAAPAAPTPAPAAPSASPASSEKSDRHLHPVKSPTPGTYYASPSPDAEAYVKVGSRVSPTTVIGLVEAMKIFNEITADVAGVVVEVAVENQQPVEFGQVLIKIDPNG